MMTETEKQLAYHRHELNRFRLMGYADCLANVHREAIKRLTRIQEHGPVLSDAQAEAVAYWIAVRRSAMFDYLGATTKLTAVMARGYVEWLITTVKDCQCDMRDCDWEAVLGFLKREGGAFALSLPKVNDVSFITHNIRSAIACPA